jgi:cysteinyl-tRNA synthetase
MLVLHNTISGKKQPFVPHNPSDVRIYVCGPTTYDYAHLGHARCYVIYDVLVRHLRASGFAVTYCRNVTDIDDKILDRARQGSESPAELVARFTTAFHEDMARLGNLAPDMEPKVTDNVPAIIALAQKLVDSGAAYVVDGDVYFSVSSFSEYGKLSHRKLEALQAGASGRVEERDPRKKHPCDFVLWKRADSGPTWESPWGAGRPGWHIECSAMAMTRLGPSFDLHGGGLDLVFPHHENEIAISESVTHETYARHWMHNGFVEVDKQKMSKSLGNFFTARELFTRVEPEAIRYFTMTVHYRASMSLDCADDTQRFPQFEEAERRIEYIYRTRERVRAFPERRLAASGAGAPDADTVLEAAIAAALDDDLNMPAALAAVARFLRNVNDLIDAASGKRGAMNSEAHASAQRGFGIIERRLGLGGDAPADVLRRIRARRAQAMGIVEADIESKVKLRAEARAARDFAKADAIRLELNELRIELLDAEGGTDWRIP